MLPSRLQNTIRTTSDVVLLVVLDLRLLVGRSGDTLQESTRCGRYGFGLGFCGDRWKGNCGTGSLASGSSGSRRGGACIEGRAARKEATVPVVWMRMMRGFQQDPMLLLLQLLLLHVQSGMFD